MLPFCPVATEGVTLPDGLGLPGMEDGLPVEESLPAGEGIDGIEAELELELELEDGIEGMLLDGEDEEDGMEGMLLEDEDDEDDEGIDGMELCEDCWLADSQPARTRAVVLITNNCLTVDLFMLKCPCQIRPGFFGRITSISPRPLFGKIY